MPSTSHADGRAEVSHFGLMAAYAGLVSLFFVPCSGSVSGNERVRLFLQLFLGMMGGALILAWLMYMLPSAPPAPIP